MNVTPKPYQYEAYQFAIDRRFAAFFMETGTGKTLTALLVMEEWTKRGKKRFVVIAPNAVTPVWLLEAQKWGFPLRVVRLEGTGEERADTIRAGKWDVIVTNYESIRPGPVLTALARKKPQGLILDELQRVKNRNASQAKGCRVLSLFVKDNGGATLGLTGTPVVNRPTDLWSEFDVLSPEIKGYANHPLGYGSFASFDKTIAIVTPHPRLGWRVKQYEFPPERLAELKKRVAKHAIEKTKAECLNLPPRSFDVATIPMGREQAKLYKALKRDYIATLDGITTTGDDKLLLATYNIKPLSFNEKAMALFTSIQAADSPLPSAERRVSVAFAVTLMARLQQIAAGHVKADDGTTHLIPSACKTEWLEDNLPLLTAREWGHKVVIFCRFVSDIAIIRGVFDSLDIKCVSLSGDNSKHAGRVVAQFQGDDSIRGFIGNVAVASTGITLTAADRVVFYTNSFAWGDRAQAEDRTYRIGQERKVEYTDLVAEKTVDVKVLENLRAKATFASLTVRGLADALRGDEL